MQYAAIKKILVVCSSLLLAACFQIGPAYPERDGKAYLEGKGYAPDVVQAMLDFSSMEQATFEKLARESSVDVRFLVAQNPFISSQLLERLVRDASDFVRGGAALNPHLTPAQILALSTDESHTTRLYIARNPHVPEQDLIRLHEEQGMDLVWFAMNPRCPEVLKQKMRDQNDEEALYWLDMDNRP